MARADVPRGALWIIGAAVVLTILITFSGQRGPERTALHNVCNYDAQGRISAGQTLISPSVMRTGWAPVTVYEDGSGFCTPGGVAFPEGTFVWDCKTMGNRRCGKGAQ